MNGAFDDGFPAEEFVVHTSFLMLTFLAQIICQKLDPWIRTGPSTPHPDSV